ncbi:MAG: phosphoribosylamine--glycine ligase [Alistipes sp.]|jgi:phosphoribosylamine--glycine ligase|nr:phosphoribosylamine--glycine ligase [Alistipes sp.]
MTLPEKVNILLLGGGGREHAIARSVAASPRCGKLYIAPGNAGTALCGTNVDIEAANFGAIKQFVVGHGIGLVVVGPEDPLVKGIVDFFADDAELKFVPVVGPSQAGARLEGSKDFAKAFMTRHGIPTAAYRTFGRGEAAEGKAFLATLKPPYVLKADGLAAGKGVVIPQTLDEAHGELDEMLGGKFGSAGSRVVVEEFLKGIECSVFVATDGENYKILPVAKDYKRVGEGDTGPNTGGMGAVSPVPFAGAKFIKRVEERIVRPTIAGLAAEKITYKGFIFIGLMNVGGDPYVIEYNVRMGDPETEVVFPRITGDVIGLFEGMVCGTLDGYELKVSGQVAATVVCTSGGYPGEYRKGLPVAGLDAVGGDLADGGSTTVFHAGTVRKGDAVVTSGGRVLAVTSLAGSMDEALAASYAAIEGISFEGMNFRRDIGRDLE